MIRGEIVESAVMDYMCITEKYKTRVVLGKKRFFSIDIFFIKNV